MFPVLGAVRMAYQPMFATTAGEGAAPSYVLFQRREGEGSERYEPVGSFPGHEPSTAQITELVPNAVQPLSDDDAAAQEAPAPAPGAQPPSATDKFEPPSW